MKTAKQSKRAGVEPTPFTGRNERGDRRSKPTFVRAEPAYDNTGTFGARYDSRTVACSVSERGGQMYGVSDAVHAATIRNRREAAKEMRRWMRTLPKGVRV